jgi:hypothetical protein
MTFEETLVETAERGRTVGPSTQWHLSVTGEPYVEVNELASNVDMAFQSVMAWFKTYAQDRKGVLYWRVKPQLEWSEDKTRCRFYMRLLISDTPVDPKFAVCP